MVLALVLVLGAATCSAAPKPKPNEGEPVERPIRPSERRERERFEQAVRELEKGRWERARESFQLIRAQQASDDPVADLAELYVARAALGPLEETAGGGEPAEESARERSTEARSGRLSDRTLTMLRSLKADDGVDERVRRAAWLYFAYANLMQGDRSAAHGALAEFPGRRLGSAVLDRDRPKLWPLLVEGLYRNERWDAAVHTAAQFYNELESWRRRGSRSERGRETAESEDEGKRSNPVETRPSSSPPDSLSSGVASSEPGSSTAEEGEESSTGTKGRRSLRPLFEFARSRAFSAAENLPPRRREGALDADAGFVRAVVGWSYLDEKLAAESLTEKQRKEIDERYREVATDLNAIGASARVRELSVKMATLGADERLVIGALVPLSGPDRSIGRRAMSGMLLAMDAFEYAGPSRVTLVFEDSTGRPSSAMKRLVEAGASAVVGPLDGSRAKGFATQAKRQKVPLMTLTAVDPSAARAERNPYVLRNFMDPITEARAVANLAFHQFGDRRAAVVYPAVGYGRRVTEAFSEEFRRLGGRVVATESYDRSSSDFSSTAKRVASADPGAVFIPDSASNVAELAAFLANQDVWGVEGERRGGSASGRSRVHYLGTSLWYDSILTRQASDYVKGAVIPAWYAAPFDDDTTREFGRRFRGVYDREPSNIEAFAFDSVRWIRTLMLGRGLHEPEALLEAFRGGPTYHGATGEASFDKGGRLRRKIRFLSVTEEAFEPLAVQVDIGRRPGSDGDDEPEAPNKGADPPAKRR